MTIETGVHDELLVPPGMERIRAALTKAYPFLIHCALARELSSVSRNGLRPSRQVPAIDADITIVERLLGIASSDILCFKPPESLLAFNDGNDRIELAIDTMNLPDRIGVDWSCGGCWRDIEQAWETNPRGALEDIFVNIVRRFGTVALYDPVQPSALRVRLKRSLSEPSSWPLLSVVSDWDQIYKFAG